jgi:hypothetical protein
MDWADSVIEKNPEGDYFQDVHFESNELHSRRLWRLPGLRYAVYPGIREGFVVEKNNLETLEKDMQYFISNRPSKNWSGQSILNRILLHWDTETGVFGIKDNTFHEDKIRYKSIDGAMAHVSLLNSAWNCLSAPVFNGFWKEEPMSCRIQFFKDYPEYNPITGLI